jgi:hypothetical protein
MEELHGIEESYLLMHVETAWDLAGKMRAARAARDASLITRGEEHRLLESVGQIAQILDVPARDVWVDYVESPWCWECGPGCVCEEAK